MSEHRGHVQGGNLVEGRKLVENVRLSLEKNSIFFSCFDELTCLQAFLPLIPLRNILSSSLSLCKYKTKALTCCSSWIIWEVLFLSPAAVNCTVTLLLKGVLGISEFEIIF